MEERKSIFDYLSQVFVVFGITILILNIFCKAVGGDAYVISSIFQLKDSGLACSTMFQFLAVSFVMVGLRYLFFTDCIIKKMSVALRTSCMVTLAILSVGIFSYLFSWFPIDEWKAWIMFVICFGICFVISFFVTVLKEKTENKALETALKKIQTDRNE